MIDGMSEDYNALVSRAEQAAASAAESAEKTAADRLAIEELMSDVDNNKIPELKAIKEDIRLAINSKGAECAEDVPFSGYAEQIDKINNFVTAGPSDIISGKIGADINGNPVTGTLQVTEGSTMSELQLFDWMTILNN